MAAAPDAVPALIAELSDDLFGRTLPFWLRHSVDAEHGGFFNCLDEHGEVTETTKHIWLQGRQVWMLAKVANTYTDEQIAALAARHAPAGAAAPPKDAARCKVRVEPVAFTRANLISAARGGADFLLKHAVRAGDGHVFFALDAAGEPAAMQRKPFSAYFMVMALSEVATATGDALYRTHALELFDRVLSWIATPGSLGKAALSGAPALAPLNVPMITLNVISELSAALDPAARAAFYAAEQARCVAGILAHIVRGPTPPPAAAVTAAAAAAVTADAAARGPIEAVLEGVRADGGGGADYSTADGRTVNPGHVVEAGWFLLDWARRARAHPLPAGTPGASALPAPTVLVDLALEVIDWAYEVGWDGPLEGGRVATPSYAAGDAAAVGGPRLPPALAAQPAAGSAGAGGMLYFLDAQGYTPPALEWSAKLWWPAAEAMVAFAMAHAEARGAAYAAAHGRPAAAAAAARHLARLQQVSRWVATHLADHAAGEWFGYCGRDGAVTHRFKGGAYKGCFHVPRCLLMCIQLLQEAQAEAGATGSA